MNCEHSAAVRMLAAGVSACMLLAGCQLDASRYRLEGFDEGEQRAISLAVADWQRHGCAVQLIDHGEGLIRKAEAPCGHPDADGCYLAGVVELGDTPALRLQFTDWEAHTRIAASHELGHALGFGHSSSRASIMWPTTAGTATSVTEDCQ